MFNPLKRTLAGLACLPLFVLVACAVPPAEQLKLSSVFTVQGPSGQAFVRTISAGKQCPSIAWEGGRTEPMTVRAAAATPPLRGDGAQADSKSAVFDVLTCEAPWPDGAVRGRIGEFIVPAPRKEIRRIVLIGDTGCRMKASEDAFQDCNDPQQWPFAQVARSAAMLKPDLVIHVGDIHYRESPCPPSRPGCANSPWGYGFDAWSADLFVPAKPLLETAPWVFVRGNHESCFRAGQGWYRFIDPKPFDESRSCNDPAQDALADYSEPFTVALSSQTQLIVFDSSITSGRPFATSDRSYGIYKRQMAEVDQFTHQRPNSFFLSHHPLLAFAPLKKRDVAVPAGNSGMLSVLSSLYERLMPDGVSMVVHGHVHLFEAISFSSNHPASLVVGNSGSANEGAAPGKLPPGTQAYPGAVVSDYAGRSEYGFAVLDRIGSGASEQWQLTEYSTTGQAVLRCSIVNGKSQCLAV